MSKRSSSPHGLGFIPAEVLSEHFVLKHKKPSWSQWLGISKPSDQVEYDPDDLEKVRRDLVGKPELLSQVLTKMSKDPVMEQRARDILKEEREQLAIAAQKEKRRQEQQIADNRPLRPADPEETERTEFFGKPLHERELPTTWIGKGVHNYFTNPRGRGGKSKRVKSKRVKSKRNKHRNTRK